MPENGHAHIIFRVFSTDTVGVVHRAPVLLALGHDYYAAVLALAESAADELPELVHISLVFRDYCSFRTCSYRAVLGEESGIPSHHLHEKYTVV